MKLLLSAGGSGDSFDLNLAVHDNRTDTRGNSTTDFAQRLVVTVQADALRVDARGKSKCKFARRRNIDVQPEFVNPSNSRAGQEDLASVVNLCGGSDQFGCFYESTLHAAGTSVKLVLVDNVERCAEL